MSGPAVSQADTRTGTWRDPLRPAAERVADLLGQMTLEEKVAQLTSVWPGDQPRDSNVAPNPSSSSPAHTTGRPVSQAASTTIGATRSSRSRS